MKGIKNFKIEEFFCKCKNPNCEGKDISKISDKLIFLLQLLRYNINQPVIITRGLVCWEHHENTYKEKYGEDWEKHITKNSAHLTGEAADIYVKGLAMKLLYLQCEKIHYDGLGFSGVGIYSNHIHTDVSNCRINRWVCRRGTYTYLW